MIYNVAPSKRYAIFWMMVSAINPTRSRATGITAIASGRFGLTGLDWA
ncbi:MAG: hypothetical protein HC795_07170 [Coleofasciculaceae cyanobacterium RL_1_1]|nr:hypothetical protein [Coleofasciculaceae cyanobacterium RL_1_1]